MSYNPIDTANSRRRWFEKENRGEKQAIFNGPGDENCLGAGSAALSIPS